MTGCGTEPTDLSALPSCQALLADGISAYLQLVTGGQAAEVRYRDQLVRYTAATIPALKQHLLNLHNSCGTPETAAILGLNQARRGALTTSFGYCPPARSRCC